MKERAARFKFVSGVSEAASLRYRELVSSTPSDHVPRKSRFPGGQSARHLRLFINAGLQAVGPDRTRLWLLMAFAILSGILQTALMFLLAVICVALSSSSVPVMTGWLKWTHMRVDLDLTLMLASGLTLAVLVLAVPLARLQASLGTRAVARTREELILAYLGTSLSYRASMREGYLSQLTGEYCQHLAVAVQQFIAFFVAGTTVAVLLLAPVAINPKIAGAEFVGLAVAFAIIGPLSIRIRRDSIAKSSANRDLGAQAVQTMRIATEIESFSVGAAVFHQLGARLRASADALERISFRDALTPAIYQYGAVAIGLISITALVTVSPGSHPGVAAIALLMLRILGYARAILFSIQHGSTNAPYIERIQKELARLRAHARHRGSERPDGFEGLALHDVHFAFGEAGEILRGVSLDIQTGEAVGIVGPSGGGKSTLCALLVGLYVPTAGRIMVGNVALREIAPDAWSQIAAYVPQDCKLLSASVAENIRFFRAGFDEAAVEAAARAAQVHEELAALPQGYQTIIGPGAHELSGGQRQRLAIARALLASPKFLVLDEPSSALDAESEHAVMKSLAGLKGEATLVLVTHRSSMLGICDRVLRLERGILG